MHAGKSRQNMVTGQSPKPVDGRLADQTPTGPPLPIAPATTLPKNLRGYSPASPRALFQLQTATIPAPPASRRDANAGKCSRPPASSLSRSRFRDARNDLLPPTNQHQNPCFDNTHLPQLIAFLRRTGLGFTRDLRDGVLSDYFEIEDLDARPHRGPDVRPRPLMEDPHRIMSPSLPLPQTPPPRNTTLLAPLRVFRLSLSLFCFVW